MTSKSRQEDVRRQNVDGRMRQASSSARIEGLGVTDATKSPMIAYAGGKITSEEARRDLRTAPVFMKAENNRLLPGKRWPALRPRYPLGSNDS
jgi:hypothetical protein